jgi:hypothetical protein
MGAASDSSCVLAKEADMRGQGSFRQSSPPGGGCRLTWSFVPPGGGTVWVSASSAIRWLDRPEKQGDVAAIRQGGDRKS